MKIGFIGLGIMGKPMAMNLHNAGYDLMVCNRTEAKMEPFKALGIATTQSHKELGESCDVIMTMLPDGPDVEKVMLGEDGVGMYMKTGSVFVDMSSINPMTSRKIGSYLAERGVEMIDAPVSGGEPKAIEGTLSFMCGGKEEVFEAVKPMLEKMGASVTRCGEIGAGNTVKLANQIIVACNIQALAEALSLTKKAGVDPEIMYRAIRGGLAGSTVMDAKSMMMIEGNANPGFRIDLHIKDLNNAVNCAHECGAMIPMTAEVMEVLQWLHARGDGSLDHSAISRFYEEINSQKLS